MPQQMSTAEEIAALKRNLKIANKTIRYLSAQLGAALQNPNQALPGVRTFNLEYEYTLLTGNVSLN